MEDRWLESTREFLSEERGDLGRLLRLVLGVCRGAPDFSAGRLFPHPLEKCTFTDYKLDASRRGQNSSLAPMFAETLNSQLQLLSLAGGPLASRATLSSLGGAGRSSLPTAETRLLRATLETIGFTFGESFRSQLSRNKTSASKSSDGFSLPSESSLLFTMEPQLLHRQTYKPLPQGMTGNNPNYSGALEEKLRRKLVSDKNLQKLKFSGIAASKKRIVAEKRVAEKPAQIFRSFRDGDYPDIQISYDDILAPLLGLATRDPVFAKEFFVVTFKSLIEHSNTQNKMEDFKMAAAGALLSCLQGGHAGPELSVALLQLCRLCLRECMASGGCRDTVVEAAKACGADWLGKLLLEEISITDVGDEPPTKRRAEQNYEEGAQLPALLSSKVRALEVGGRWDDLKELYGLWSTDLQLEQAQRLHCTEEYFHCFARLSDWENLVQQMGVHVSPDMDEDETVYQTVDLPPSFPYDLVWETGRLRNSFLRHSFSAHVQRVARVATVRGFKREEGDRKLLKDAIQVFGKCVDSWLEDEKKRDVLQSWLAPSLCTWGAVTGRRELDVVDRSLDWARALWATETSMSRHHSAAPTTLDTMLSLAETHCFLSCASLTGVAGGRHSEDSIRQAISGTRRTWRHCVPSADDDTLAWDVRLACRSVYTAQLQQYLKRQLEGDADDSSAATLIQSLSKVQRRAELHLLQAAVHQRNLGLSEKLKNKHEQYLDEEEELSWGLQLTKLRKLEAESCRNITDKSKLILNTWKYGGLVRKTCSEHGDVESHVELLLNASEMADQMCSLLGDPLWASGKHFGSLQRSVLEVMAQDKAVNPSDCAPDVLQRMLVEYSSDILNRAVGLAEGEDTSLLASGRSEDGHPPTGRRMQFLADTYMHMVHYCRKAKEEYCKDGSGAYLTALVIRGILRAMKYGHREARKLFLVILLELEQLPQDDPNVDIFTTEVKDTPSWQLLPWAGQMLARLPSLQRALEPTVLRLAADYPAALRHPYRLSRRAWGPCMGAAVAQFDKLLIDRDTETLTRALGTLCCPKNFLKNAIEKLLTKLNTLDNSSWTEAIREFISNTYPEENSIDGVSLRGQLFSFMDAYKNEFIALLTNEEKMSRIKSIGQIYESVKDSNAGVSDRKSLALFSPYLARYGEEHGGTVEVPGQYQDFRDMPPDVGQHVTIARFHSEVTVIKTQRTPVRVGILGSDGRRRSFLVKRGEDLRQDERVQQLLRLLNYALAPASMAISTFKVIPLSQDVGLIEWVEGCATLKEFASYAHPDIEVVISQVRDKRDQIINNFHGEKYVLQNYGELAKNISASISLYREGVNTFPRYVLRDALMKLAVSPDKFVSMRNNFVRSLAPMNIAHWILGIGDRHLSNCLVSLQSGAVLGVDFGYAFGAATQFQLLPELLPFRLTPQLLQLLAPQTTTTPATGQLRSLMCQALEIMCSHRSLLLAAMEVFVREPSLDWHTEWSPKDKINQCKRKLCGVDPAAITLEDLSLRKQGPEYIPLFSDIVQRAADSYQDKDGNRLALQQGQSLTVNQQVDCLITLATDPGILSVTYSGWSPWF